MKSGIMCVCFPPAFIEQSAANTRILHKGGATEGVRWNGDAQKNWVNDRRVKGRRKHRDEKKSFCQNLLSSASLWQNGSTVFTDTLPLCLFLLLSFFFSSPSLPLFSPVLPHWRGRVTVIYFTSDPLYDCGRFAFMPDALPKRLSDKAMNTLSGSSLLVSLCSTGHWCWY